MDFYIICMCFGQEIKKFKNDLYLLLCLKFFMPLHCSDLFSKRRMMCVLWAFLKTPWRWIMQSHPFL